MIYTSSYSNVKSGNLISISEDKGKMANFEGKYMCEYAPRKLFWDVWYENIGKIDDELNEQFYINQYYYQVLRQTSFYRLMSQYDNNPILLCYENSNEFCHRFLLAAYLEIKYGIEVPEILSTSENGEYLTMENKPYYLKDKMLRLVRNHENWYNK